MTSWASSVVEDRSGAAVRARSATLRARRGSHHLESSLRRMDRDVRYRAPDRALLDRLTHHVHILEMNGQSFRLNHSRARNKGLDDLICASPPAGNCARATPSLRFRLTPPPASSRPPRTISPRRPRWQCFAPPLVWFLSALDKWVIPAQRMKERAEARGAPFHSRARGARGGPRFGTTCARPAPVAVSRSRVSHRARPAVVQQRAVKLVFDSISGSAAARIQQKS